MNETHLFDPQTLYRHWEDGRWTPADVVRATLRELLPAVAESLTPPDREGADWDALGANAEEIREFAIGGLTRRLNVVGVPLSTL